MTSHHDVSRRLRDLAAFFNGAAEALESQAKALSEARAKLFPYADATEISGMSWSGFYLIGDKKSIRELKRLEHRSAQLEVFSKEYDLRTEALEAHVQAAEARLAEAMGILEFYAGPFEYIKKHGLEERTPDFYDELNTGERAQDFLRARAQQESKDA